jgi:hypothetical protein
MTRTVTRTPRIECLAKRHLAVDLFRERNRGHHVVHLDDHEAQTARCRVRDHFLRLNHEDEEAELVG